MSAIKILRLQPLGTEFFQGSESFLQDLTEQELGIFAGSVGVISTLAIDFPLDLGSMASAIPQTKATVSVGIGLTTSSVIPMG